MADPDEEFPFEQFGRGELPINLPRRSFFSGLLDEISVYNGEMIGGVGLKLTELGSRPDEELYGIIPLILPGSQVHIEHPFVVGKAPDGDRSYRLFTVSSPALVVFNLMNGENALSEIADGLRRHTGWDEVRSFAYVRGVFLSLVTIGMARPKN